MVHCNLWIVCSLRLPKLPRKQNIIGKKAPLKQLLVNLGKNIIVTSIFSEAEDEQKKEGGDDTPKEKEGETEDTPAVKKDEGPSKATVFLDSLRSVASQVPSLFKGQKDKKAKSDKDADVEAGEKEELLDAAEEVNFKGSFFSKKCDFYSHLPISC